MKCIPIMKIEQTRSLFDMRIRKPKYDTAPLDSDVSKALSSLRKISLRKCLKPTVIDTDEIINTTSGMLNDFANYLFDLATDLLKNSTSYEYKNEKFVSMGIPIYSVETNDSLH